MNIDEQEMLRKLIIIFKPDGYDCMGTPITKKNILTYHHIVKRKNGETILVNGALLTKSSHRKLNILESKNPILFELWQDLFIEINSTMSPPTERHKQLMKEYMKQTNDFLYGKEMKLKMKR